jgi:hypothetical protein
MKLFFAAVLVFAMYADADAQVLPAHSQDQTLGVVSCASSLCHGSIAPWNASPVAQNEYVVWSRLDKHARAYNVLLNAQSRRMAEKLALAQPAHQSAICLDCHTHNSRSSGERHKVTDGVACEACHGPAQRWIARHTEPQANHQRNLEDGLYPVEQPLQRAQLCLSCHLGAKDKVVTHRIMAAGHPRLNFELNTFTSLQPAHYKADADYLQRKGLADDVQAWAMGQAVAVSTQMDLLMDPVRGRDGVFPELTLFDCHACHHPMTDKRWSAQSAFGKRAAPGLVRLNDAAMVMLRLILRQIDPALGEKLGTAVRQLHQGIAGQGDLMKSAKLVKDIALEATQSIQRNRVTGANLNALALSLVDDGMAGVYSDYMSAEQASMALGSVVNTLYGRGQVKSVDAVNKALTQLRLVLRDDESYNMKDFQSRLQSLRPLLADDQRIP